MGDKAKYSEIFIPKTKWSNIQYYNTIYKSKALSVV